MLRDRSSPLWFFILHFVFARCQLPHLQPGDLAPSFALQTLDGRIVYRKSNSSSQAPRHPVILHLFTRRSAFLEALWNNETSVEEFIESSPGNTHFVFMSSSDSKSVEDVLWMRSQLHGAINKYYKRFVWISGIPGTVFRSRLYKIKFFHVINNMSRNAWTLKKKKSVDFFLCVNLVYQKIL